MSDCCSENTDWEKGAALTRAGAIGRRSAADSMPLACAVCHPALSWLLSRLLYADLAHLMWLWILCWQGDRQVNDVTVEWNATAFDLSHVLAIGASMG